jgi:hypothetical protein
MFVERPENKGKMIVDFQLVNVNYYYAPNGVIRIARFETSFHPYNDRGYYGDIYMKRFIRKWKNMTLGNMQRKREISMVRYILGKKYFHDIINLIVDFI